MSRHSHLGVLFALAACGGATAPSSTGTSAPPAARVEPGAAAATTGAVVATVGGVSISRAELDKAAASQLMSLRQQEDQILRNALEQLVADKLVAAEAAAKGTTPEEVFAAEVMSKVSEPTDADVDRFYTENQARMNNQPKEAIAGRIREYLKSQRAGEVREAYIRGLREKAGVKILLDPYRVPVSADDDPVLGNANAPVTIVEFSDFQCPFCSRAATTVHDVVKKYGPDKVRLVFRDFPLSIHPLAPKAAEAGACAAEQGKFWEQHDAMFARQDKLAVSDLKETAKTIGLDVAKFNACLDGGKFEAEVKADMAAAESAGISGTPAFFINGRPLTGAVPAEELIAVIDDELSRQASK